MGVRHQKIVAVDVGQHSLNMVLGNGQGLITKAASVRLPDGVITTTRVNSTEMLTAALQEAKSLSKISERNSVLCIGGREVIIRYFTFPKMNDLHLRENIISELSPYLPFSADNYTIDFAIKSIKQEGKNIEYNVMVVAVHNEVVLPYVEAFRNAGLRLSRIDIRDNCYEKLFLALSTRNFRARKNFGVIDVGAGTTTTSAYSDGMFFINNTNNIGGNYFRDSIGELYGIDSIRAEEKKLEVSKLNYSQQDKEVIDTMNIFFEKLVADATRVFEFYKTKNDKNIEEIFFVWWFISYCRNGSIY